MATITSLGSGGSTSVSFPSDLPRKDMVGNTYTLSLSGIPASYVSSSARDSGSISVNSSYSGSSADANYYIRAASDGVVIEFTPKSEFTSTSYTFYAWYPYSISGYRYYEITVNINTYAQYDYRFQARAKYTDYTGATKYYIVYNEYLGRYSTETISVSFNEPAHSGFTSTGKPVHMGSAFNWGTTLKVYYYNNIENGLFQADIPCTEHSYTINYVDGQTNATLSPSVQVRYTQNVTFPVLSGKTNYRHSGWNTNKGATSGWTSRSELTSTNGGTVTLYPIWIPTAYVLHYRTQSSSTDWTNTTISAGSNAVLPGAPDVIRNTGDYTAAPDYKQLNETYSNDYWCTDSALSIKAGNVQATYTPSGMNADIILYAHFSIKSSQYTYGYIARYDTQGGTAVTETVYTVQSTQGSGSIQNKNVSLSATVPVKTNYEFLGWNEDSKAKTGSTTGDFSAQGVKTFYAIWKVKLQSIAIAYNESTKKFTATLTPSDVTVGLVWKTSTPAVLGINQSGVPSFVAAGRSDITAQTEDGAVVSNKVTLYATSFTYDPNYTNAQKTTSTDISANSSAKSFSMAASVNTPTYPVSLDTTSNIGYNFLEWITEKKSPTNLQNTYTYASISSYPVDAGTAKTVYAMWGRYTHKIEYNTNAPADAQVSAGWNSESVYSKSNSATIPLSSIRPACNTVSELGAKNTLYAFLGWSATKYERFTDSASNAAIVTSDQTVQYTKTLYAVWIRYTHTCKYKLKSTDTTYYGSETSYYDSVSNKCQFKISVQTPGETDNKDFSAWVVNNVAYVQGDTAVVNAASVVFVADWSPIYTLTFIRSIISANGLETYSSTESRDVTRLHKSGGKYTCKIPVPATQIEEFGDAHSAEHGYCKAKFTRIHTGLQVVEGALGEQTSADGEYTLSLDASNPANTIIEAEYQVVTSWSYGAKIKYNPNTVSRNPVNRDITVYDVPISAIPDYSIESEYSSTYPPSGGNRPEFTITLPSVYTGWSNHNSVGWTYQTHINGTPGVNQYLTNDFVAQDVVGTNAEVSSLPGEYTYYAVWQTSPEVRFMVRTVNEEGDPFEHLPDSATGWEDGAFGTAGTAKYKVIGRPTMYCGQTRLVDIPIDQPSRGGYAFKGWTSDGIRYNNPSSGAYTTFPGSEPQIVVQSENIGDYDLTLVPEWAILYYYRARYYRSNEIGDFFEDIVAITSGSEQVFYPTRVAENEKYSTFRPNTSYKFIGWSRKDGHDSEGNYVLQTSEMGISWGANYTIDSAEETKEANTLKLYAAYSPKHKLTVRYASEWVDDHYEYYDGHDTEFIFDGVEVFDEEIGEYIPGKYNVFFPSEAGQPSISPMTLMDRVIDYVPTWSSKVFLGWDDTRESVAKLYRAGSMVKATTYMTTPSEEVVTLLVSTSSTCMVYFHLCSPIMEDGNVRYLNEMYSKSYRVSFREMMMWDHVSDMDSNNRQCIAKVYKGTEYNPDAEGLIFRDTDGTYPNGYDLEYDRLYFTPVPEDTAEAHIVLEYKPATYNIVVYPGKNPGSTQAQYTYQRTYTLDRYGGDTLDITDFAGAGDEMQRLLKGNTAGQGTYQYSFSGYSFALEGDLKYRAGDQPDYNGFQNAANAYPKNGETVYYHAQWGKYVTQMNLISEEYSENIAVWAFKTGPNDAGNQAVRIYDNENNILDKIPGMWSAEYRLTEDTTTVIVTFETPGVYEFVIHPIGVSPEVFGQSEWPTEIHRVAYTELKFENDGQSADGIEGVTALLPNPIRSVVSIEDMSNPGSVTYQLEDYLAVANSADYEFGGWSDQMIRANVQADPLGQIECTLGSGCTLYPLWAMKALFVLNGGYWADGQNHDIVVYRTYSEAHSTNSDGSNPNVIRLPPASAIMHNTKRFNGWAEDENGVVTLNLGVKLIHAKWRMRDLRWHLGKADTAVVGPYPITETGADGKPTGNTYPYIDMLPEITWLDQGEVYSKMISFNTEENMPSHIPRTQYPDGDYCTVRLVDKSTWDPLKKEGEVLWTRSYRLTEAARSVIVNVESFPKTLLRLVNGVPSYDADDLAVGPLYEAYTDGAGEPQWRALAPNSNGQLVFAGYNGMMIIIGVDRSSAEVLRTYRPIRIQTRLDIGCQAFEVNADGNNANWLMVSNKTAHKIEVQLPVKLVSAETYIIESEIDSEYCFFRRIYENWLTATPDTTGRLMRVTDEIVDSIPVYGAVATSIRADEGCYAVVFTAYDVEEDGEECEHKYVLFIRIIDDKPDAPICKLTKYESVNSRAEVFYLSSPAQPNLSITSMSKSMKAQLNQSPILTKSSQFNYIIDLGNTETYNFTVTRTPPANPVDVKNGDPAKWSNKFWMTQLKDYFDQWQNANYNSLRKRSGGYNLVFDPVVDYNGFPKIDKNVFLSSALSYKYDRAQVSLSFKFTVASMLGREASEITSDSKSVRFSYWPSNISESNRNDTNKSTIEVKFYNSVYIVPDIPADATGMIAWKGVTSEGTEVIVYPGEEIPYNSVMSMNEYTAFYGRLSKVVICDQAMSKVSFDPAKIGLNLSSNKVWATCTAVGAGGGGGNSSADLQIFIPNFDKTFNAVFITNYFLGGGGASGQCTSAAIQLSENVKFSISVGAGGGNCTDGGPTSVTASNTLVAKAAGGSGGQLKSNGKQGGNYGGEQSSATGIMNAIHWGEGKIKGSNGYPNANVASGTGIRGGMGTSDSSNSYPGSGGGAAKLRKDYRNNQDIEIYKLSKEGALTRYSVNPLIMSIGASTKSDNRDGLNVDSCKALYGGGGCSYLKAPNWDEVQWNIQNILDRVKDTATPGWNIVKGFEKICNIAVSTWEGGWDGFVNATIGVNEDEATIQIKEDGKAGADGVAIIEFYTI